ncbi:Uncharacterised protein [Bordetella pertussis]|nr:Uncharacterised protein [Bordetella pertussis]CFP59822.1 Uncharacterised protein [Bordetella pertussis]
MTPPRSIVTVPCWTSRPMRPPLTLGRPVVSVRLLALSVLRPLTLMPLGLAMMRSAPLP